MATFPAKITACCLLLLLLGGRAGAHAQSPVTVQIYQTSAGGNKLSPVSAKTAKKAAKTAQLTVNPTERYQTITGFGGAFTESSAYLLNRLSPQKRHTILQAYFGEQGANYSLTRTHINSCDFSLGQYAYANVPGDTALAHFSIAEDLDDLVPMILAAQKISKDGFKIIASPWTAPPWMKDNNHWVGGKLLPQYNNTWALYFAKYLTEYKKQGIDIWGITVENEPHGNGNNWESMLFSPKEMTDFVQHHLGPRLAAEGYGHIKILGYDQNRAGLQEWIDEMYRDEAAANYFAGTAIHWYESTYDYFPKALQYAHNKRPDKYLIQTEACIDADVPHWQDDNWYWSQEATDWGWDWAGPQDKHLHPKYVPVFRYATDIIGCLNNYVDGWIDWNMVLDKQGGPNWFKNWCNAPVIVSPETDEVYFTPLYYTMVHFSKFIRPGAVRIAAQCSDTDLMLTAAQNPDKSIAVVLLNTTDQPKTYTFNSLGQRFQVSIAPKALQTILLPNR